MDIKVRKHYYYLKTVPDNKYHIFMREEIFSPMLSVKQLNSPEFDSVEDAERFVVELNKDENTLEKSVEV